MIIAIDCDDTLIDTVPTWKQFYLDLVDKNANIPDDVYPSQWPMCRNKEDWEHLVKILRNSKYLTMIPPLPGAIDGVRALKKAGHSLFVLTGIGDDPNVQKRRQKYLSEMFGDDTFSDVICINAFESKADVMKKMSADILIDDGAIYINDAIKNGAHGIWLSRPYNAHLMNSAAGKCCFESNLDKDVMGRARIAENWPHVVEIVNSLNN